MNCKNHPAEKANYTCESCKANFCTPCITARQITPGFTAYICKECGGKCNPFGDEKAKPPVKPRKVIFLEETKIDEKSVKKEKAQAPAAQIPKKAGQPNFWKSLPGTLIFPLRGKGVFVVLILSAIVFASEYFAEIVHTNPFLQILWVIFFTYSFVYGLKVLDDAIKGEPRLSAWIDLKFWLNIIWPMVYVILASLLCFLPAAAYFLLKQKFDVIFFPLLGGGVFFLPMFFVRVMAFKKPATINPIKTVTSIARTFFAYLILCVLIFGLTFGWFYLTMDFSLDYLTGYEQIVSVLSSFVFVYFLLIVARLLGIFGRFYQQKIG
ncbi:MAG: hypothetical protein WC676_07770 [Candidatus Omnitrophota bacterium]